MGGRILVIDSDFDTRIMLKHLLTFVGHEVLTASNPEEALSQAAAWDPDLVITEFLVPARGGRCVLEELRHRSGSDSLPVIVWTATDLPDVAQRVRRAGGIYRTKPTRLDQIVPLVERLVGAGVTAAQATRDGWRPEDGAVRKPA